MRPDRQQTPDPCLACRPPINARALAARPIRDASRNRNLTIVLWWQAERQKVLGQVTGEGL